MGINAMMRITKNAMMQPFQTPHCCSDDSGRLRPTARPVAVLVGNRTVSGISFPVARAGLPCLTAAVSTKEMVTQSDFLMVFCRTVIGGSAQQSLDYRMSINKKHQTCNTSENLT